MFYLKYEAFYRIKLKKEYFFIINDKSDALGIILLLIFLDKRFFNYLF